MLKQIFLGVENMIFPQYCVNCSRKITSPQIYICDDCLSNFTKSELGNWISKLTCNNFLDFAISPYWFDDLMNGCIHRVKYEQSTRLLKTIALSTKDIMIPLLGKFDVDMLLPVPLHHVKRRERGYNQSKIIAEGFSEFLHIPVNNGLLKRSRWTTSQTKLTIRERNKNINHAFKVKATLPAKRIAIIDDVLTTGSTTNECARILKCAGAEFVGAISLATPKLRLENPD